MPIIASIESETGRLRRCASIDRRIAEFGGVYRPFSSFSSSPRGTHFLRHKLVDLAFRIDFYQNLETFRIFLEVRAREKLQVGLCIDLVLVKSAQFFLLKCWIDRERSFVVALFVTRNSGISAVLSWDW